MNKTNSPFSKWIPIEEKLPNKKGHYLCTTKVKSEKIEKSFISVKYFDGLKWENVFNLFEVIAWQELPHPYDETKHK